MRRSKLSQLVSLVMALFVLAPGGRLLAQGGAEPSEAQLQLARSLYYDGLELLDKHEWAQAADRLQRVLQIRDSAVASFHLANALRHLERYVEARLLLQRVLNDAKAGEEIRAAAAELLPAVEHSMGRLTVQLVGGLEGVQILVDGRETPPAALDVPVPVDPHEVSVVALRDGEQVAETTVLVGGAAGLQVAVTLEIPARSADVAPVVAPTPAPAPILAPSVAVVAAPETAATAPLEPATPRRDESDSGLLGQWWFWTAIAAVTAGAVITTVALTSSDPKPADLSSVRGTFEPGLLEGKVQ